MIQLTLTKEESQTLREILLNDFSDLRMEIAGTELMNYREKLKEKGQFLKRVIESLEKEESHIPL
ncbi:MAG: hypothetical protein HYR76_11440 [Ignavibacteria bacterium]|nr:hypothetical protein [Ignavibacteria bacterium]MBI3766679.1 hypothetical protein [Ignavibacteriales bacterium]